MMPPTQPPAEPYEPSPSMPDTSPSSREQSISEPVADVIVATGPDPATVQAADPPAAAVEPPAVTPAPQAAPHFPSVQVPSLVMSGDSTAALRLPQGGLGPAALTHSGVAAGAASAEEEPGVWGRRLRIAGISVAALAVVVVAGAMGAYVAWSNSGQLADGLVIQGQPVGGLTRRQAEERLEQHFGRLFVTVKTPDETYKLGLGELGGRPAIQGMVAAAYWYGRSGNIFSNMLKVVQSRRQVHRVVLPVQWDKAQLKSKMWIVAHQYHRKPRDARLEVNDEGVHIIPDQEGRKLNLGATLHRLQHLYYVGRPSVEAVVEMIHPRLAAADLAGTDVVLGGYTTHFDTGEIGRSKNLRLAAAAINGRVVMPGELFSFNKTTGERTFRKGYRTAHIFVRQDGEPTVIEGLGGGTCQVSSTLFNAVRKTNNKTGSHLRITERNHHMLPVTYVPDGLDATVAWPDKDFKFRNTFPYPVYLRTSVHGGTIVASVWARVPNNVHDLVVPDAQAGTGSAGSARSAKSAGERAAGVAATDGQRAAHRQAHDL